MIIPIKQALLEGYTLETIVEAIHANNKHLDKRRLKDPNTSYAEGKAIEKNRKELRDDIRHSRSMRDDLRKLDTMGKETAKDANYWDNDARGKSQTGGKSSIYAREYDNTTHFPSILRIARKAPRGISSAKE